MITEPNFSISVTRLSGHNNASTTDVPKSIARFPYKHLPIWVVKELDQSRNNARIYYIINGGLPLSG